jgi:hypothetical protein
MGKRVSRELSAWRVMLKRCTNQQHKDFTRYGAKGIKVCPEWAGSFQAFLADMGPAPSPLH